MRRIPESSYVGKETDDIDVLITQRNVDRRIFHNNEKASLKNKSRSVEHL